MSFLKCSKCNLPIYLSKNHTTFCSCPYDEIFHKCHSFELNCERLMKFSANKLCCDEHKQYVGRYRCFTCQHTIVSNNSRDCNNCFTLRREENRNLIIEKIMEKQAQALEKITALLERVVKVDEINVLEERLEHLQRAIEFAPGGAQYEKGKAQYDARPTK